MRQQLESASGQVSRLRGINLNPDVPSYPKNDDLPDDRGQRVAVNLPSGGSSFGSGGSAFNLPTYPSLGNQNRDEDLLNVVLFQETGFVPENTNRNQSTFERFEQNEPSAEPNDVSYYMPSTQLRDFPDQPAPEATVLKPEPISQPAPEPEIALEDESDYFKADELVTKLTDSYVLRLPGDAEEPPLWTKAARTIKVDAWSEGTSPASKGTIFVDGVAYNSGDNIERSHNDESYTFRFEGVIDGQVVITSLKRETNL